MYQKQYDFVINVLDYGAKRDGVTDDAAAIQKCLDLASSRGGGTIRMPAGQYLIGSSLKMDYGVILSGDGRGKAGDPATGTRMIWNEAGACLIINSDDTTEPVYQYEVRNIKIEGTGAIGIQIGEEGETANFAAPGVLHGCHIEGMVGIGYLMLNAQLCRLEYCWAEECGIGFHFTAGTNASHANTACTLTGCRAFNGTTGFWLSRLTGSTFTSCVAESNQQHGVRISVGGTNEQVQTVQFTGLWLENNLQAAGTGRGQLFADSTSASARIEAVFEMPKFLQTPASNYDTLLAGGSFVMDYPKTATANGIRLKSSSNASLVTWLSGRWTIDPTTYTSVEFTTGAVRGAITASNHLINTQGRETLYTADNAAFKEVGHQWAGYATFGDGTANATTKAARLLTFPYNTGDPQPTMVHGVNTVNDNIVYVGGGTSGGAAATLVRVNAAADNTTVTGTTILEATTAGVDVVTGDLEINSGPLLSQGAGSPEGIKSAPVGSLYFRTDGGVGSSGYIKQVGTGNTGWAPFPASVPGSTYMSGAGDPITLNVVPDSGIGTLYFDTTNKLWWKATGSLASDWLKLAHESSLYSYEDGVSERVRSTDAYLNLLQGYLSFNAGTSVRTGTGSPQGVVTATPGSLFLRTDGAEGTTGWIKETGVGNTGWAPFPSSTSFQQAAGHPQLDSATVPLAIGSRYFDNVNKEWYTATGLTVADWDRVSNKTRAAMTKHDEGQAVGIPTFPTAGVHIFQPVYLSGAKKGSEGIIINDYPNSSGVFHLEVAGDFFYSIRLVITLQGVATNWGKVQIDVESSDQESSGFSTIVNAIRSITHLVPPTNLTGVGTDKTTFVIEEIYPLVTPPLDEYFRVRVTNLTANAVTVLHPTSITFTQVENQY